MGENSTIEWCHHTFNPWLGCTSLSPACDHCYAESWAKRTGNAKLWQGERRRTSAGLWREPIKWNRRCATEGIRERVFCASLADVFDNQVPAKWRYDLWELIAGTRHLDWMLLTKRPENILKMLPVMESSYPGYRPWVEKRPWENVWLGTTIEDRARLRRIDHLRRVPAAIRFLSIEPLLEDLGNIDLTGIDLVIVGGESGPHARTMHPAWVRSIRDQCLAKGVAFFFKQWGRWLAGEERRNSLREDLFIEFGDGSDFQIICDGDDIMIGAAQDHSGEPLHLWRDFWADGQGHLVRKLTKNTDARLVDGVQWNQMPKVRA